MRNTNFAKPMFVMILIITGIIIATVLKITSSFLIPITLAVLFAFVFYPLCRRLSSMHIPWMLSIVIVLLLSISILYGIINLLASSLSSIVEVYPKYEARFNSLYRLISTTFQLPFDENQSLWRNVWSSLSSQMKETLQTMALSLSSSILSAVKVLGVMILFLIFLLIEMNPRLAKNKINAAFPDLAFKTKIKNIISKTMKDVSHYLSIKFFISLMTGILVGLTTLIARMDFPVVWGFLAFVLNFIPNFGSIISWAMTTLFAAIVFAPSWGQVIIVSILVITINMVLGSFIEPRWEGEDLGLSPFVILASLSFWSWMWGFIGMILAVPLMVVLKIAFENSSILYPISVLLGNGKVDAAESPGAKKDDEKKPEADMGTDVEKSSDIQEQTQETE
ncbi:MAG TPA: AI-2E family transporter [Treponema sp.]|nr:AI-2E family transporter [Treponema sp.]HCA19707.1 AI-2E family transporter [Treponema sp.]